jgi:hypothetical protein
MNAFTDRFRRDDFQPEHAEPIKVRTVMHWMIFLEYGRPWQTILPYRKAQRALRLFKARGFAQAYMTRFGKISIKS